jgi:hypothetical protein
MSQENVERWPAGSRIYAFEAICMLTSAAVAIMLAARPSLALRIALPTSFWHSRPTRG